MKDQSSNLPSWAYQLGYRLMGNTGTYDSLLLLKGFERVKAFDYWEIPNIIEMEEIIKKMEEDTG